MNIKIIFLCTFLFLNSCQSNWTSTSGSNSNLSNDKMYCKASAEAAVPVYLCRNPLMCAPDETSKVLNSLSQNNAFFKKCMFEMGYKPQ